ncbi:MAG: ABC transporter ATP-binding protein [Saprospiraceae bacterium]
MISCSNIIKSYDKVKVLKGVSLEISHGSLVSIVGSSGAGKSTLLHILGTLDQADEGELILDGQKITKLKHRELAQFRNRNIGFIYQFHHLLPELTALENACLPAYIAKENISNLHSRAKTLLDMLGLGDRFEHKPGELSGGEQQRVALARALINRPKILLADEPTGNLDQENAKEVLKLILAARRDFNITTLLVTHDMNIAAQTERTLIMKDGIIIQENA